MRQGTKAALLIGALVALFLSFPLFAHLENRPAPSVLYLTEERYEKILLTQAEIPDRPSLGTLLIQGETAPYDQSLNIHYVPESMDTADFESTLSWSRKGMQVYFVPDALLQDKAGAIQCGHVFTLIVTNGREFHRESVVFTGVPAITLHTESEKSYVYEDGVPTGTLKAFYPSEEGYEVKSSIATFRPRGNTTAKFGKTPLRLCLYLPNREKNYTSLLGLREDDDWILNSLYTDSSKIRDQLSIDLWNAIADTNPGHDIAGTRMRYVEIFIDDSYEGLYGLIEPIGKKSTKLNTATDILYQGKSFLLREEDFAAARNSLAFFAVEIKYPKKWTGTSLWDPITEFVDCFYWHSDQYTYEEMVSLIDLSNAIDHTLFLQASTATDNFFHNTFYLAKPRSDGSMYLTKIPWDLNYSFGDRWDDAQKNLFTAFDESLVSSDQTTRDMQTLLKLNPSALAPLLSARWKALRAGVLSFDSMEKAVADAAHQVVDSGALGRDGARWPDALNDASESEVILRFAMDRLSYLDAYYDSLLSGGAE